MGDRGQVKVVLEKGSIWLYTHWGASELVGVVRKALIRGKSRWEDPEYLTRIIFCEMVRGDEESLTGFGIGLSQHDDVWRVVTVNTVDQSISVNDYDSGGIGPVPFATFVESGLLQLAIEGSS
jgi:hypothetical protein